VFINGNFKYLIRFVSLHHSTDYDALFKKID